MATYEARWVDREGTVVFDLPQNPISVVEFSSDAESEDILAYGHPGGLELCRLEGEPEPGLLVLRHVHSFETRATPTIVRFNPETSIDGEGVYLVAAMADHSLMLMRYPRLERCVLNVVHGHMARVTSIAINSQNVIATYGEDRKLLLWTELTNSSLPTKYPLSTVPQQVQFHPSNERYLFVAQTTTIRILDWEREDWIHSFTFDNSPVISFFPINPNAYTKDDIAFVDNSLSCTTLIVGVPNYWWQLDIFGTVLAQGPLQQSKPHVLPTIISGFAAWDHTGQVSIKNYNISEQFGDSTVRPATVKQLERDVVQDSSYSISQSVIAFATANRIVMQFI